jgi:hypothetical protein
MTNSINKNDGVRLSMYEQFLEQLKGKGIDIENMPNGEKTAILKDMEKANENPGPEPVQCKHTNHASFGKHASNGGKRHQWAPTDKDDKLKP